MAGILSSIGNIGGWTAQPMLSTSGTGSSITANGVIKAKAFIEVDPEAPPFDIDHEAMQASLETLRNLWLAAYSNQWVRNSELDGFHYIAAHRLHKAHKMERMYLPDGDRAVFRIIED